MKNYLNNFLLLSGYLCFFSSHYSSLVSIYCILLIKLVMVQYLKTYFFYFELLIFNFRG